MKKRIVLLSVIIIVVAASVYFINYGLGDEQSNQYEFATVSRGDIVNKVSATGTLSPVTTIEVGTQISGIIDSVFVDYNSEVRQGQILAVLDTTILKATVMEAEAAVDKNKAELENAKRDYQRFKELFEKGLVSESEYYPYEVAVKSQQANFKSAQAALIRANKNIEYAVITSPIDGIIIQKNVESGQTVAASLSTPTLFIIAKDLSAMEILAEVDETDIGEIKQDQAVTFEVSTYDNKEFSGVVKQVRLQPTEISNVVTYTVVVQAANEEGLLLPGMTATLDFITESRQNVLLVPNKALRFKPTEEQMKVAFENHRPNNQVRAQATDNQSAQPMFANIQQPREIPDDMGMVWTVDSTGQLMMAPFRMGLIDGSNTELLGSRELSEGSKVIISLKTEKSSSASTSRSSTGRGFGPPPRF